MIKLEADKGYYDGSKIIEEKGYATQRPHNGWILRMPDPSDH